MSDVSEIEYTEEASKELASIPADRRAAVLSKIQQVKLKGWQKSLEVRDVKKLEGEIYEIRQVGKGASFRVLCFQTGGETGRIVVTTTCAAKSKLLKRKRLKQEIRRAENRRLQWLERHQRN